MKQTGKNPLLALIPLLTISFVSNIAPYIYIPSLPDITKSFRLNQSQAANTMMVYSFVLSITLLLVGIVGDVWNKKYLLVCASVLIFMGATVASVAPQFEIMLLGWALQAVGAATVVVVGQTWIGQSSTNNNITVHYSYLTIILSFAPLVAPIVGGVVNEVFSWQYNFYLVAVLSLFASVFIYRSTPPISPVRGRNVDMNETAKSYCRILFRSKFVGLISTSLVCFVFQAALMNYSSFLFIDQLGLKSSTYGLISIPVVMGIIAGQFPVLYIEKKRGIVTAYLFNSMVVLVALLASVFYYFIVGTHSVVELALVIFIFNVGFGGHNLLAIRNVMLAFGSKRSHTSSLINFLNHFAGYVAATIVQILFSHLYSSMQIHAVMCIFTVFLVIVTYPFFRKSYQSFDILS